MAIKIGSNFAYNGKLPNFERDSFETKAAMKAFDENSIDEGHLSYCKEDGNIYQYKHTNTVDAITGRWRIFKTDIVVDAALNGTSKNPIQNKAVFEALKLKADTVALDKYQPKYNADYIAKEDLSELPITKGILDLNGHSINASFSNHDGELTIQNGTILRIGKINAALNIINCTIESTYVEAENNCTVTFNYSNIKNLGTDKNIYCNIFNSNVGSLGCGCEEINIYNSFVNELTCYMHGYKTVIIYNSCISTINYDPASQPIDYGYIYLYNCSFRILDLDSYPGSIDVQLCSCCDYNNDTTYINGYYTNTDGLRETAYAPVIQNDNYFPPTTDAVYNALQLKADVSALGAYQPKYKADYVATKDFNYSELALDVHVVDLNGYTMTTNKYTTVDSIDFYNGVIKLDTGNQTDGCLFFNVNIDTLSDITYEDLDCNYEFCNINSMNSTSATTIKFSTVNKTNFASVGYISFTIISNSTFSLIPGEFIFGDNVIIDDTLYKKCYIKNNKPIDKGYESNIDSPTISGNAPSCEAVTTKLANYATKTELNSKADASALNNYVTTATANSTYAKKSDITNIYKFKGTKTNYADLPTTNRVTGDVWNITNADAEHGIKAGDNVAWNGTEWDNLSGTVDLSAYATTTTTDAMSADIKKLMDKAFPFTVKVSIDKTLAKKGTSQPVKVTITPKIGDDNTNVDTILINGGEHHGAIPYVYSDTATTTTTYNVRADKDGRTAQGSATITFVNPSYDGAVAANFTATEANIKALTETLRSGKGGTRTFNLNNQKACIAYPKVFGAATGIKDANGFDYLASYTRSELNVNGELYYVYLLTNAVTITDFKQTIS